LRASSSRHDAKWSIHASIVQHHRPSASTGNSPAQVSPSTCLSMWAIGASLQRRAPGAFQRTTARTTSCPSARMVADTRTTSPTVRFGA
jgi:hypothetical protein